MASLGRMALNAKSHTRDAVKLEAIPVHITANMLKVILLIETSTFEAKRNRALWPWMCVNRRWTYLASLAENFA